MDKEKEVLDKLVEALNLFLELESQHPDELNDFKDGLDRCRSIIGLRFAREYRHTIDKKKSCSHQFSKHMMIREIGGLLYFVEECLICEYERKTLV